MTSGQTRSGNRSRRGESHFRNWDIGELVSPARSPERNGVFAEVCVSDSGNAKTVFSRQPSLMSNRRCGALSFLLTQSRRFGSRCWVGRGFSQLQPKKGVRSTEASSGPTNEPSDRVFVFLFEHMPKKRSDVFLPCGGFFCLGLYHRSFGGCPLRVVCPGSPFFQTKRLTGLPVCEGTGSNRQPSFFLLRMIYAGRPKNKA